MVQHKGVKVTIVRHHDRQPYNEYKPNKKTSPGHRKAKTPTSKRARITAAVDECVESSWTIEAKDVNGTTAAASLEDRQVVWDSEERLIDGKWKSYGLTFAPLKIDDGAELTEEDILHDRKAHGRVTVTVARGTRVRCEPYISPSVQSIEETPTSSRDVAAKHHVSHTTKLIDLGECEPLLNSFTFDPITSDTRRKGGPPVQFIFRARSKQSVRLLNIKSKRPALSPVPPSASGIYRIDTATGPKTSFVHARCDDDDDEEPCTKKTKTETDSKARALKLVFKHPHTSHQPVTEGNNEHKDRHAATDVASVAQSKPHPQPATGNNEHKDSTAVDMTASQAKPHSQPVTMGAKEQKDPTVANSPSVTQPNPHSQPVPVEINEHKDPTAANATPVAQVEPHPQPPIARNEPKPKSTIIKDEDEGEDLVIVSAGPASRVQPSSTPAPAQISVASVQYEDQAMRERKKAILKMRLEQLNIDREQLKIEQQLLEMED